MKRLHSIKKITQIYDTGQLPVLVECNDLKDYVCKHSRGQIPAKSLFAEVVAMKLLKELKVRTPEIAFVKVQNGHDLGTQLCQPAFFKSIPCFATEYIENARELNLVANSKLEPVKNPDDLLTIAFFDLWVANEDRRFGNFNLLISTEGFVIPIDHDLIFNSLTMSSSNPIHMIQDKESLIVSNEFYKLTGLKIKSLKHAEEIAGNLYLRISRLKDKYESLILEIPEEWKIPVDYLDLVKQNLFAENWLSGTRDYFLKLITLHLK